MHPAYALNLRSLSSCSLSLVLLLGVVHAQSTFHVVPDLPGGIDYVDLRGVSADGSTVVGTSSTLDPAGSSALECITWTMTGGTVGHGDLPGGPWGSHGNAVSGTGAHYAGTSSVASGEHAQKDMVDLGSLVGLFDYSAAVALSDDGVRAVGFSVGPSGYEACVWSGASPPVGLGDLPGGFFESYATDISGDGHIVVGYSDSASGPQAFYRDLSILAGTLVGIGDLPGGGFSSRANTCSYDGSVIWGESDAGMGAPSAFKWTAATGMVATTGSGNLPHACTADGKIAVGSLLGFTAVIWDEVHGGRDLKFVLTHEYGLGSALAGWTLLDASGISADGLVICGQGYDPMGVNRGWVVRLVRPSYWNFCFGDGSANSCPCLNNAPFGSEAGCLNSLMLAAELRASGTPSVAADTLVLTGAFMPATASALYFQGDMEDSVGYGTTLGDGLRCVTGSIVRLGAKVNSSGTSSYPVGADARISVRGGVLPGQTRFYQGWYRNASAFFCTPATYNFTNGTAVTWML